MKEIHEFPKNLQTRIKKAGGVLAYHVQLSEQGSKGGRKSSYVRTKEQKQAHSQRMKAYWAERRGEDN